MKRADNIVLAEALGFISSGSNNFQESWNILDLLFFRTLNEKIPVFFGGKKNSALR